MKRIYPAYDLALITEVDWNDVAAAVASLLSVPIEEIEIGNARDSDQFTWKARATCKYTQTKGDSTWYLEIEFNHEVATQPNESSTPPCESLGASQLAEKLGIPLLYTAQLSDPSAHWLATPGGLRTRACCYEFDSDDQFTGFPGFWINSVECRLPGLPRTFPVALQTDIIHQYRVKAAISIEFRSWAHRHEFYMTPSNSGGLWQQSNTLAAWENMPRRMIAGWPPDGWYPIEFYQRDLQYRDELAAMVKHVPAAAQEKFNDALNRIDELFRMNTCPDDQEELAISLGLEPDELAPRAWWWHRFPNNPSWTPPNNGAYKPSCSDITAKPFTSPDTN